MRFIDKSPKEPPELLEYRKSAGKDAYWDGFPAKNELKPKLLQDQGFLCCYCMRSIDQADMKIEHYLCRSEFSDEQLNWKNLLAACTGGEGQPFNSQTCDTRKRNDVLNIDPRKKDHIDKLRYLADGTIKVEKDFERDINQTLNLNSALLVQLRQGTLDAFRKIMEKRYGRKKAWTSRKLKGELQRIQAKDKLPEFAGMLEWWLERKIRQRDDKTDR